MAKLNQIVAVVNGEKTRSQKAITEIYHKIQKETLFSGMSRTYQKLNDDDKDEQAEKKLVQYTVSEAIGEYFLAVSQMFDLVATQDIANCAAKANVVVEGKTIIAGIPVSHLLFLEKQMVDVHTFVSKLPILDNADTWVLERSISEYRSEPTRTNRTKKTAKVLVKYEATKEHPAQTECFSEDIKVGEWITTKFSGAIPASEKRSILARVESLQKAIKFAREEANQIEANKAETAKAIFGFVFQDQN